VVFPHSHQQTKVVFCCKVQMILSQLVNILLVRIEQCVESYHLVVEENQIPFNNFNV
jgi:hypothetical protein